LKRLAGAGIDAQRMMQTSQLEVLALDRHVFAGLPVRPGCHAGFSGKTNPNRARVPAARVPGWSDTTWIGCSATSRLRETPFFVPPEQFLDEMRERQSLRTAS
jgi:hypothetical protein